MLNAANEMTERNVLNPQTSYTEHNFKSVEKLLHLKPHHHHKSQEIGSEEGLKGMLTHLSRHFWTLESTCIHSDPSHCSKSTGKVDAKCVSSSWSSFSPDEKSVFPSKSMQRHKNGHQTSRSP